MRNQLIEELGEITAYKYYLVNSDGTLCGEDITCEYAFDEVTEDIVDIMKSKNIQLVIDFVNYSTATDGSDTIILTPAQMKAIEYVLAHDLGM